MTNNDTAVTDLTPDVEWAGKIVAQEWPNIIDAEDARQEIWVKILESVNYADQLLAMPDKARRRALAVIGHQAASRYRNDYELFSGNVRHSTTEVRALLEDGALLGDRDAFDAAHFDVRRAFRELASNHRAVIEQRYVDNETPPDTKALTRAVDALTDRMNRTARTQVAAHSGGRRAMTNAKAHAITNNAL